MVGREYTCVSADGVLFDDFGLVLARWVVVLGGGWRRLSGGGVGGWGGGGAGGSRVERLQTPPLLPFSSAPPPRNAGRT